MAGLRVLLRLVVGADITRLDRLAQFALEIEFIACPEAHLAVVVGNRMVETAHRPVQGRFGTANDRLRVTAVYRMPGHADWRLQEQVPPVDQERLLDRSLHLFGEIPDVQLRFDTG